MKMDRYQDRKLDWCSKDILKKKVDCGETFAHVARLEGGRTLLAYATHK